MGSLLLIPTLAEYLREFSEVDIKLQLIRLFPEFDFVRAPVQLVYLPDRHMTPKMKSFVEFVLSRFE
jgi:DNA-binding transcriptional LysR family regulator